MAGRAKDSGEAEVQATVDAENEQGFAGERVDETPLENYTLGGVAAGKPTPETEKKLGTAADKPTPDTDKS
jgi:hypothetical protein